MKEIPDISRVETRLTSLSAMQRMVKSVITSTEKEISSLEAEVEVLGMVAELFRSLIDKEIEQTVASLKRLQDQGMGMVFPDQEVSVDASINVRRGKVSVDLATCQGESQGPVMDAYGGSVATLQSVLLRLQVIKRRGLRPCLFLDESLAAFDPDYAQNMSKFFQLVCKKMNIDMMVITHSEELCEYADKIYQVRKGKDGVFFEDLTRNP